MGFGSGGLEGFRAWDPGFRRIADGLRAFEGFRTAACCQGLGSRTIMSEQFVITKEYAKQFSVVSIISSTAVLLISTSGCLALQGFRVRIWFSFKPLQ